ncbi:DUF3592 domain-containing protein [Spirosoma aerolatum]|uniref:DUF3592 domain-containing protein n=1 Tax=Spirosoma aerolatum TaxID=1211326 RepID=UPI0009ACCDC7|nr:DUF3592 domain-containing protein [Spirosoma aerolatum]
MDLDKIKYVFLGLFALLGTVFLIVAYMTWQSTQQIVKTGIETKGMVIGSHYNHDSQGRRTNSQAPVIQFTTQQGQSITYYSNTYTSPPSFTVGERVTLWYRPNNPQEDIVLEGVDGWILPAVFGLLGVVFSLIGYPLLIMSLRKDGRIKAVSQGF